MRNQIVTLISLCIGIFLYASIADQSYAEALNNSYYAVGGGLMVWYNTKGVSK